MAPHQFRFLKTDNVGAPAAEEDSEFLHECFVDNGDLALIRDPDDRRVLILGRTGTGKSAILRRLLELDSDRVIQIKPENLALTYIANSTVLNFFADLGINLDPFYKLLWRHVLTVELLNRFFDHHPVVETSTSLFDKLRAFFSQSNRGDAELRQAVDYLEEWGKSFWNATEYRVKEITQKFEDSCKDSLKMGVKGSHLEVTGGFVDAKSLSEEQRTEVIARGQEVVAGAQVRDLHQVSELLGKVLSDKRSTYILVIDGLDDNWVEERLRYRLIMGLIMIAREFISVRHAKIVLALRRDLIERVFRLTRDSTFQEEKYKAMYLPLTWTKRQILDLLDKRVKHMVQHRYKKQPVGFRDLLPSTYRGHNIDDFIFSIADRPRDVIALFNV